MHGLETKSLMMNTYLKVIKAPKKKKVQLLASNYPKLCPVKFNFEGRLNEGKGGGVCILKDDKGKMVVWFTLIS